jgi:hypothetical protein
MKFYKYFRISIQPLTSLFLHSTVLVRCDLTKQNAAFTEAATSKEKLALRSINHRVVMRIKLGKFLRSIFNLRNEVLNIKTRRETIGYQSHKRMEILFFSVNRRRCFIE